MTGGAPRSPDGPASAVALVRLLDQGSRTHPPVSEADAAVTLVLRAGAGDVELLLIERAQNPRDPASGQVALPGGQVAAGDRTLGETALRELEEEVGLTEDDLQGPLRFVRTDMARRFGLRVAIFAAEHAPHGRGPSVRSPEEVASVFWLPRFEAARTEKADVPTDNGSTRVDASLYQGHILWGFTRRIVREFFGFPKENGG
jgi:8-oxo-dGTP diphosphatase